MDAVLLQPGTEDEYHPYEPFSDAPHPRNEVKAPAAFHLLRPAHLHSGFSKIAPSRAPKGFEPLAHVDCLFMNAILDPNDASSERKVDSYAVRNGDGKRLYGAKESTEALSQQLHFDALRGFEMMIYDRQEREMFTFRRPVRCDTCCCPSFMQEMHIFSRHCGEDRLVGSVTQVWSLFAARFILDAGREDARLIVRSTPFICSQFMDIAFEITDRSERVVGGIQKLRVPRDARRVNDKNLYAIAFPVEIDVEMKAVCMGALFLINFLYNEDMPKRNLVKSRRQLKQVDSDSDESDEQSA